MDEEFSQLELFNQLQVLTFYQELQEDEKLLLKTDIKQVDWTLIDDIYQNQILGRVDTNKLKPSSKISDEFLQPLPNSIIQGTTKCDEDTLASYRSIGRESIKQGKIAAVLLAGGQGTRLGVDYPKGMYDVGLPSHKTLFQLQAERIMKLSEEAAGRKDAIFWYVMTSGSTLERTREFFRQNEFFGLKDKILFFDQNAVPCLDFNGKVLLDQKYRLSRSPNGNGGLYEALHERGIIDHMKSNGVEFVHVYCVDNILVRVCDPVFMGYCITKGAEAGAKIVQKERPDESVGTICMVNQGFKVIEYSEIPDDVAQKLDETTGELLYNAGNICDHFFNVGFLDSIKGDKSLRYHLALKKIPHVCLETGALVKPDKPNGIKLEKFVFDVFEFTDKFFAWQVKREDEFSPLKNADGTEKDNPSTALKALLRAYEKGLL